MPENSPHVVIIDGPNGAGKTTISRAVLAETLGITEFVNADSIAAGLSGFAPEHAALAAGRVMLERLHELARAKADFAFETTMASRTFVPWLKALQADDYRFHAVYVWVKSPEISIRRVAARVRKGGHDIPTDTIRRRYQRGLSNFVHLYRPIAESWRIYDNSAVGSPRLVASAAGDGPPKVFDRVAFRLIERTADATGKEAQNDF